tara:strand:- start:90 stop:314 length:225 start_codon:yes stop_codon:yes gene_type:complete
MAKIDNDGVKQIEQHIMNPMTNIYEKLDSENFELIREEFQHVVDFVKKVQTDWYIDDQDNIQVLINGKVYRKAD